LSIDAPPRLSWIFFMQPISIGPLKRTAFASPAYDISSPTLFPSSTKEMEPSKRFVRTVPSVPGGVAFRGMRQVRTGAS
jgi:hypothetical protein